LLKQDQALDQVKQRKKERKRRC